MNIKNLTKSEAFEKDFIESSVDSWKETNSEKVASIEKLVDKEELASELPIQTEKDLDEAETSWSGNEEEIAMPAEGNMNGNKTAQSNTKTLTKDDETVKKEPREETLAVKDEWEVTEETLYFWSAIDKMWNFGVAPEHRPGTLTNSGETSENEEEQLMNTGKDSEDETEDLTNSGETSEGETEDVTSSEENTEDEAEELASGEASEEEQYCEGWQPGTMVSNDDVKDDIVATATGRGEWGSRIRNGSKT